MSIGAGSSFSLALDKQGRVWGWGSNAHILNNVQDNKDIKRMPTVVYENEKVVKVRTEAQERKESFISMIFWAACCVYLVHILMGCTNWQGAEFRIGIGQYNGANETKTFVKEVEKK